MVFKAAEELTAVYGINYLFNNFKKKDGFKKREFKVFILIIQSTIL